MPKQEDLAKVKDVRKIDSLNKALDSTSIACKRNAARDIAALAEKSSIAKSAIIASNMLQKLQKILINGDQATQQHVAAIINHLAHYSEAGIQTIIDTISIPVLLKLLDKSEQTITCSVIDTLLCLDLNPWEWAKEVISAAGITRVISLLRSEHAQVIQCATKLLSKMCSKSHSPELYIMQEDTLATLINLAVSNDEANAETREYALSIISNLIGYSAYSKQARVPFLTAGALPTIVELLSSENTKYQEHALVIIRSLTQGPEACKNAVIEAEVIEPLIKLLASKRNNIQECAADAACKLSYYAEKTIPDMFTKGMIPPLLNLLQSTSDFTQEHVIYTLTNFALISPEAKKHLMAANITPQIVALLSSKNEALALCAARCMAELCATIDEDFLTSTLALNPIPILAKLLRYPNQDIQLSALTSIANLFQYATEITRQIITDNKVLPDLIRLMYCEDLDTRRLAVTTALNLVQYASVEFTDTCRQAGILPPLIKLFTSDDKEISSLASDALNSIGFDLKDLKANKELPDFERRVQKYTADTDAFIDFLEQKHPINEEPDLYCPITHSIVKQPVLFGAHHHRYEKNALETVQSTRPNLNPLTNTVEVNAALIPDRATEAKIDTLIQTAGREFAQAQQQQRLRMRQ